MANYIGLTRSNYFRVTDSEALKRIIRSTVTDGDGLALWERTENGATCYGFGAYGSICGLRHAEEGDDEDGELDADTVYAALAGVVAPDDAIIITDIGCEKLRYLTACAVVVTRKGIYCVDLRSDALEAARRLLENPEYSTRMEY